jgi:hypothetical protein
MTDLTDSKIYFNKALMISKGGNYLGKDLFDKFLLDNKYKEFMESYRFINCDKGLLIPLIDSDTLLINFLFKQNNEIEIFSSDNELIDDLNNTINLDNIINEIKIFFKKKYDISDDRKKYVVHVGNKYFEIKIKEDFSFLFEYLHLIKELTSTSTISLKYKITNKNELELKDDNFEFKKTNYRNFYDWIDFLENKYFNT